MKTKFDHTESSVPGFTLFFLVFQLALQNHLIFLDFHLSSVKQKYSHFCTSYIPYSKDLKLLINIPDTAVNSRLPATGVSSLLFVQPWKFLRVVGHSKHSDKVAESCVLKKYGFP